MRNTKTEGRMRALFTFRAPRCGKGTWKGLLQIPWFGAAISPTGTAPLAPSSVRGGLGGYQRAGARSRPTPLGLPSTEPKTPLATPQLTASVKPPKRDQKQGSYTPNPEPQSWINSLSPHRPPSTARPLGSGGRGLAGRMLLLLFLRRPWPRPPRRVTGASSGPAAAAAPPRPLRRPPRGSPRSLPPLAPRPRSPLPRPLLPSRLGGQAPSPRSVAGGARPWRTSTRSTRRRRTRSGRWRSSSSSTRPTRWWCAAPGTSPCKGGGAGAGGPGRKRRGGRKQLGVPPVPAPAPGADEEPARRSRYRDQSRLRRVCVPRGGCVLLGSQRGAVGNATDRGAWVPCTHGCWNTRLETSPAVQTST